METTTLQSLVIILILSCNLFSHGAPVERLGEVSVGDQLRQLRKLLLLHQLVGLLPIASPVSKLEII